MELSDYVRVLRRRWALVATLTLMGLLVAATSSLLITPSYTAKSQLFVAIQNTGSVSELQQGNTFTQARVASYVKAASTPAVLQPVIDSLGLNKTSKELAKSVVANVDADTVIISIAATDPSPSQAAAIAQSVSESLVTTVEALERPNASDSSPVKLSVITPATAPLTASSPSIKTNIAFGTVLGLGLGLIAALAANRFDTRIRGEEDVAQLSAAPLLGGITFEADAARKPLLTQTLPQSPRAESFRQIRTNLQFANLGHHSGAILITSSLPGEGKSTTATNLAISLAQSGQSVALVDADLRRPRVHEYLGLERNAGLTTALIGRAAVTELLQPWGEDSLWVLTSGEIPPNPSELLGSDAMSTLIDSLEDSFDVVIIDAPPLLPVTDAAVLAQKVSGVVVVVGSSRVRTQGLTRALASLHMVNANVLGIILNFLPTKGPDAYTYSYYSYESVGPTQQADAVSSTRTLSGSHLKTTRRAKDSFTDETLKT